LSGARVSGQRARSRHDSSPMPRSARRGPSPPSRCTESRCQAKRARTRTAVRGRARPAGREQVRLGGQHARQVAAARQPGRLLRLQRRAHQARPASARLHLRAAGRGAFVARRGVQGAVEQGLDRPPASVVSGQAVMRGALKPAATAACCCQRAARPAACPQQRGQLSLPQPHKRAPHLHP